MSKNMKTTTETVIVNIAYTARGWVISFEERLVSAVGLIVRRERWEEVVPRDDHKALVKCLHGIYCR